jgi:prephenate dehydrogenase
MRVGLIGHGQFGRFMATHLAPYAEVRSYDTQGGTHTLQEVCDVDVLVFAVPVQHLYRAALSAQPHVAVTVRIADVSSVKVRPLELLKAVFPDNQLLGTHPIFGPQSGKSGIAGLPIVVANVSWSIDAYDTLKRFCADTLRLKVIERTPVEHDQEMARIQALTHFIGRALDEMGIKEYDTATQSYRHLLELRELLHADSWELFATIQSQNQYAKPLRQEFLETLQSLQDRLEKELGSGEVQKDR